MVTGEWNTDCNDDDMRIGIDDAPLFLGHQKDESWALSAVGLAISNCEPFMIVSIE